MSLNFERFAYHVGTLGYNVECVYIIRSAMNAVRLIELIHLQTSARIILDMASAHMEVDDNVSASRLAVLVRVPSATVKSMIDETTGDPKGSPRGLDTLRVSVVHDALIIPDNVQSCAYLGNFVVALNDLVGNSNASMSLFARNNVALALALPVPGKDNEELAIARFVIDWGKDVVPDEATAYCGIFADVKWFYKSIGTFGTLASALLDATLDTLQRDLQSHVQKCIGMFETLLPFMKYLDAHGWPFLDRLKHTRLELAHLVGTDDIEPDKCAVAINTMDRCRAREHALLFALEELVRATPVYVRAPSFATRFVYLAKQKLD